MGNLLKKKLFIDDFDNNTTIPGSDSWKPSDSSYALTYDKIVTDGGVYCLKISFNKQQAWSYIHKTFHPNIDFSGYHKLKARIYVEGSITFLLKFENPIQENHPAHEKWWTFLSTGWQEIEWDITPIRNGLNNVYWFLIMVDPGKIGASGNFYIANIYLVNETV